MKTKISQDQQETSDEKVVLEQKLLEALRENELLREMQSLSQDSYYRLKLLSSLEEIKDCLKNKNE